MKTLEQKIEQAKILTEILVKIKDKNNTPCKRYYHVLRIFQETRNKINNELNKGMNFDTQWNNISGFDYFSKPELSITSTTYEKAKKRLEKQIDNKFKNRK